MYDRNQFYPTPPELARRMWAKLREDRVSRVLEPHGGEGHLADERPYWLRQRRVAVDTIEIDATKHSVLRDKGYRVVGLDFLLFEGGGVYDAVVMNPPFAQGARHVLKAWDMLWAGQVVAQLNAETLRNPHTAERQRLLSLVEQFGTVEYVGSAYSTSEAQRRADVEVALVHMVKPAACNEDWIGPVLATMSADPCESQSQPFRLPGELALPEDFVVLQVRNFRAAVRGLRAAVQAQAVAGVLASRIGETMSERHKGKTRTTEPPEIVEAGVQQALAKGYEELKDRAWASVLRSTHAMQSLSSKVQRQAEAQFEQIKVLEFNESNVYAFLLGLVQSQPELQLDMCCDVFDEITRYTTDNASIYPGWKSNDKHRTMGLRIKTSRFILPGNTSYFSGALSWEAERRLADFDKVFAMMDGKKEPAFGLVQVFSKRMGDLRAGERVSCDYFDVRYYKGAGTIHFYARRRDLVDRLNRVVGRRRQWLPPTDDAAPRAFWLAYEQADKLDPQIREEAAKAARARSASRWHSSSCDPVNTLFGRYADEQQRAKARSDLLQASAEVLQRHGLSDALACSGAEVHRGRLLQAS